MIALISTALAGTVSFDRVDLLSEQPGTWPWMEAPSLGAYPTRPVLRYVEQVTPVFSLPHNLYVGVSLGAQSLTYEHPLPVEGLALTATLQTRLLFPSGANLGAAWHHGRWRVGVSASAVSAASWDRPSGLGDWLFVPGIGVGVGGKPK